MNDQQTGEEMLHMGFSSGCRDPGLLMRGKSQVQMMVVQRPRPMNNPEHGITTVEVGMYLDQP